MNSDQRLADHTGHSLEIYQVDGEQIWAVACDTCGEHIIEQDADGIVIWG